MVKPIIIATAFLGCLFTTSCKKEATQVEVTPELERELDVLNTLKFLPLEKQSTLRALPNKADLNLIVVEIDWGRKRYNCRRGFGICGVNWFPGFKNEVDLNDENLETYVRFDPITGKHYLELPLAETPPTRFTPEDLSLKVDKPLELISSGEDSLGETLLIPAKHYSLDKTLGEHGGYKIALESF